MEGQTRAVQEGEGEVQEGVGPLVAVLDEEHLLRTRPRRKHANLGVTSIYLQGIDSGEIIETVRTAPRSGDPGRGGTGSRTSPGTLCQGDSSV